MDIAAAIQPAFSHWVPPAEKTKLNWPGEKPVAMAVLVELTTVTTSEMAEAPASAVVPGGLGARPYPDIPRFTHRQYGHRVGIFRVLDALDAAQVPIAVGLDAATVSMHPYLAQHAIGRAREILAAGLSGSRIVTSRLSEDEERAYVAQTIDSVGTMIGRTPSGWVGPEYSQSARTPAILAEAGITYMCDWVNDDQPYMMKTTGGNLWALPISYELDDLNALIQRRVSLASFERMLYDYFAALTVEGTRGGVSMVLRVRPWILGQPFRIAILERFLNHVVESGQAWMATPRQIIGACSALI